MDVKKPEKNWHNPTAARQVISRNMDRSHLAETRPMLIKLGLSMGGSAAASLRLTVSASDSGPCRLQN
jgi:hypothetical protein